MKVKTDISRSDYRQAYKFAAHRIPAFKQFIIVLLIALPILFFLFALSYTIQFHTTFKFVITAFIAGIVVDLLILCFLFWGVLKLLQHEKPGRIGVKEIEINETGVFIKTSKYAGSLSWGLAHSIEQNDKYIYIFLNALTSIIVPKKDFASVKHAEEFYDKCFEYFKAANTVKA